MRTLLSTFYVATITPSRKILIHRITESPSKAIQYRQEKIREGLGDVRILRKNTAGDYIDLTKGMENRDG